MASGILGEQLFELGELREPLEVQISYELIRLLSEQLYSSPAKAIEELVVNAWDAEAQQCLVYVPSALREPIDGVPDDLIVVFDDGGGMDESGLQDLWHVGLSRKRRAEIEAAKNGAKATKKKRLQIGKFGIGKLATYAIARQVTYLSRTPDGGMLGLSVDFDDFEKTEEQRSLVVEPLKVPVVGLDSKRLTDDVRFQQVAKSIGLSADTLVDDGHSHWTIVILERLRSDAVALTERKLQWVFSTAMPLESNFKLSLNQTPVESADENVEWKVEFSVAELPEERLKRISELTEEEWKKDGDKLISPSFPSGISGKVRVAKASLYRPTTKRSDLGRSHGFFVKVRGRLVNDEDPLFGIRPRVYQIFNRFTATVHADDLDAKITAAREAVEQSPQQTKFEILLTSLFGEARSRYEKLEREAADDERKKKDGARNFVGANLFEHPVADVLVGAERHADEHWFYLEIEPDEQRVTELITSLYLDEPRRQYVYSYDQLGEEMPLVRFQPEASQFILNEDHPIVDEFVSETGRGKELVELVATGEALLEVYLREAGVQPSTARILLERRDSLLRSLARERVFAPAALARNLRAARNHDKELEAALVAAMRLLGFSAEHISNAGEPDGIATYNDGRRDWIVTLEAKSTGEDGKTPSLGALDFAGLVEHMDTAEADGCLLISPAYPGEAQTKESAAARRGKRGEISCWTIEDLARVVEAAEHRHISAVDVRDIVRAEFAPKDVKSAVDKLLSVDRPTPLELRGAVLDEIIDSYKLVPDADLGVSAVAVGVNKRLRTEGRGALPEEAVRNAVSALVDGSQGGLHLSENKETVFVRVDPDEVRRRLVHMTAADGPPRRTGTLRKG